MDKPRIPSGGITWLVTWARNASSSQVLVGEQLPTEGTIWKVGMLIWLCPEMWYTGMPQNCGFDGILIWGHAFVFAFNELLFLR